ncbi:MAG: Ribosome maturation factor RimP [Legionellaceae bacterium]
MKSNETFLNEIIEPVVMSLGYELLGCIYLRNGKYSTLRIYIDSPQGITLDDCQKVSHQISAVFDVEDPIEQHYDLEVSSPGMDRPLFKKEHYQRFLNHLIRLRLSVSKEGRRKFVGRLIKIEDECIIITLDDTEFRLSFDEIERANLEPEFKK